MIYLAPSILSADFANLEREIKVVEEAGAEYIHVDVMDGQFVPNLTLGAPIVKALRPHIKGVLDVHLMIEEPEQFLEAFKAAGADLVTVHFEACPHIHKTIQSIKALGMKAGVALNPGTPVSQLECILGDVDLVLIMSVNPGFGGQKFIPYALEKIKQVKQLAQTVNPDLLIEVDGGIGLQNVRAVIESGANVIVAGSAVYQGEKTKMAVEAFKTIFKEFKDR